MVRAALVLAVLLAALQGSAQIPVRPVPHATADPLIEGIDEWSDAVQGELVWPRVHSRACGFLRHR